MKTSTALADAQNNAIETTIGASALLKIFSGAQPANCAAADQGVLLATITLPADWLAASANRVLSMLGTWSVASSTATGAIGHFRLYSAGGTVHMQGTAGLAGNELVCNSDMAVAGTPFTVSAFSIDNSGGA